jgi:hypothetical protein
MNLLLHRLPGDRTVQHTHELMCSAQRDVLVIVFSAMPDRRTLPGYRAITMVIEQLVGLLVWILHSPVLAMSCSGRGPG